MINAALKLLVFFVATCSLSLSCNKERPPITKRPNIVFIMSDDHAYQAISAYDSRLIQTPNIDRLAKEGMRFTNACVTNSICAPSRAVILTGKHSHLNGKIDNNSPFDTSNVTFAQLLQSAGYQTAMFGKLHFGNTPKGFDEFKILPGQGDYYNPDFITSTGDTTIKGHVTDIITDLTIDWLENRRKPDQPFLLLYLHKAPHRAWMPAQRHYEAFTKKTFPMPTTLMDDYASRSQASPQSEMSILNHMYLSYDNKLPTSVMRDLGFEEDKMYEHMMSRLDETQRSQWDAVYNPIGQTFKEFYSTMNDSTLLVWKYQRYMQDYLGTIAGIDENVGRVLDYLDDQNLTDNTLVVYTSDQGFYLGEHGWYDKRFMYNQSFKTPLLIRWPHVITPKTTADQMVQNLDFAQTLLEAAKIVPPLDMQGESMMPILTGHTEKWKREAVYYHYYEYPGVHAVKRHYGIATREYKLMHFYYDIDEWELYDRIADPEEIENIYHNPSYRTIVDSLKQELLKIRIHYKDSDELSQKYIDDYKAKGWIKE